MNNPGKIVYKCRRCGCLENSTHVPNVDKAVILIAKGIEMPKEWGPLSPGMTSIHACKDGNIGVSDLIGGITD